MLGKPIVDRSGGVVAQDRDSGPCAVEFPMVLEEPERRAVSLLDDFSVAQQDVEVVANGADGQAREAGELAEANARMRADGLVNEPTPRVVQEVLVRPLRKEGPENFQRQEAQGGNCNDADSNLNAEQGRRIDGLLVKARLRH